LEINKVIHLGKISFCGNGTIIHIPESEAFRIEKLLDADKQLATVAINDAKNIVVENALKKKIVTREIARAEEEKQRAEGYLDKDMPAIAIGHFKLAWIHAQTAIKIAQELPKG
jgi:hypothetical protein